MNILNTLFLILNIAAYTPGKILSENYILGPGDEILIISRSSGQSIRTLVSPEGNVPLYSIFPSTQDEQKFKNSQVQFLTSGIIKASGLSIKEFEDSLSVFSRKTFRKKDSFRVILLKPRNVGVEINGSVIHPGIYMLPANSTVADAIWQAGGLKGTASYSRIKLIRNRDTSEVNLSNYVDLKNPKNNPSISGIDEIFVPEIETQKSVYIAGDILVPPLSTPTVLSISDTLSTLSPEKVMVKTRSISLEVDSTITLNELLLNHLPVSLERKLSQGNVFVKHKGKIFKAKTSDREIYPGDSVYILPLFRGILVAGEVKRPGTFVPFSEGASVEYYIARAGGKTSLAGSTEIIRGFKSTKTSPNTVPQDGDIILVKYSKTKRFAEYVSILQGILTLVTVYLAYR